MENQREARVTKTWNNVTSKLSLMYIVQCSCSLCSGVGTPPLNYNHTMGKRRLVKKKRKERSNLLWWNPQHIIWLPSQSLVHPSQSKMKFQHRSNSPQRISWGSRRNYFPRTHRCGINAKRNDRCLTTEGPINNYPCTTHVKEFSSSSSDISQIENSELYITLAILSLVRRFPCSLPIYWYILHILWLRFPDSLLDTGTSSPVWWYHLEMTQLHSI